MRKFLGVDCTKEQEKFIKKWLHDSYNQGKVYYHPSLKDCSRCMYKNDDYDADVYEYGFLSRRTDLTDEEIEELVEDMRMVINSPYDCTGQRFTRYISTHRNPNGLVSFVHAMGLDV